LTQNPAGLLHRLAKGNTPWIAYPGTKFEQRFDDPQKQFLVLYASSERIGCFIECLAHFRQAHLPGFHELEEKFGPSLPQGTVPPDWCQNRSSQTAKVTGIFADVAHSHWLARLLVDQSAIHQATFRPITQRIARTVFEREENFAGIYYTSRHGSEIANWAIFEGRAIIKPENTPVPITPNDPDLLSACAHLQIQPPLAAQTSRA